jgi:hypothetical protein
MPSFDFLEKQLGLYRDQAETWPASHVEAMRCRDIEDAIRYGLFLLEAIQRHNAAWSDDIQRGATDFSWEVARQFARSYRWWHELSTTLLAAIGEFESQGFQVEGAGAFREKYRDVSLLPLDIEQTRKSIESLEQGEGVPLRQGIDELRRGQG